MATTRTYLELTNFVLNELNEVELTSSNFSSSRGYKLLLKTLLIKLSMIYIWLKLNGLGYIQMELK